MNGNKDFKRLEMALDDMTNLEVGEVLALCLYRLIDARTARGVEKVVLQKMRERSSHAD